MPCSAPQQRTLPKPRDLRGEFIGDISGILFSRATESVRQPQAPGALTSASGSGANVTREIQVQEVVNDAALPIARSLVAGKGALTSACFGESALLSEANAAGKIGEFSITQ